MDKQPESSDAPILNRDGTVHDTAQCPEHQRDGFIRAKDGGRPQIMPNFKENCRAAIKAIPDAVDSAAWRNKAQRIGQAALTEAEKYHSDRNTLTEYHESRTYRWLKDRADGKPLGKSEVEAQVPDTTTTAQEEPTQ